MSVKYLMPVSCRHPWLAMGISPTLIACQAIVHERAMKAAIATLPAQARP